MKRALFIVLLTAILLPARAQESGIRFFHGTWDEAVALAKKEKKKIFIDFFTEWCGPCLNMALTVFPLPEVGEAYNKHFVCLKIDAEKGEGKELAKKYGVHSYPSYIFVEPKTGDMIHRSGGNKPAADFIADIKGALNPKLSSIYLAEKYKGGFREPERGKRLRAFARHGAEADGAGDLGFVLRMCGRLRYPLCEGDIGQLCTVRGIVRQGGCGCPVGEGDGVCSGVFHCRFVRFRWKGLQHEDVADVFPVPGLGG